MNVIIGDLIEEARNRLRTGTHSAYEGLSLRCLVFYVDMQPFLRTGAFPKNTTIAGLCEIFHSATLSVGGFQKLIDAGIVRADSDQNDRLGIQMLTILGLIQIVTQIVEATTYICDLVDVPSDVIKKREYWAFRNRVNHVILDPSRRSTPELDKKLPLNEFKILSGSIDTLSFRSSGAQGYAIRHISMSNVTRELQMDLMPLFDKILERALVRSIYGGFNRRDISAVLAYLAEDVLWANGMHGGHVRGREGVRAYWTKQWAAIQPRADPLMITEREDGVVEVEVHQVVRDLEGKLLLDEKVRHVFRIEKSQVVRFDIEAAGGLASLAHD